MLSSKQNILGNSTWMGKQIISCFYKHGCSCYGTRIKSYKSLGSKRFCKNSHIHQCNAFCEAILFVCFLLVLLFQVKLNLKLDSSLQSIHTVLDLPLLWIFTDCFYINGCNVSIFYCLSMIRLRSRTETQTSILPSCFCGVPKSGRSERIISPWSSGSSPGSRTPSKGILEAS